MGSRQSKTHTEVNYKIKVHKMSGNKPCLYISVFVQVFLQVCPSCIIKYSMLPSEKQKRVKRKEKKRERLMCN